MHESVIYKIVITVFIVLLLTDANCQEEIIENGYYKTYYKTGSVSSEGFMRDGKPDGYWKTFYPNGILKSEGNRKNFLLDSAWIFYSLFGDTVEKVNYLYGKKNGYNITYNIDRNDKEEYIGKIIAKELYVNDKKEGQSYYYFNNGKIKKIINFRDNKADGYAYEFEDDIITTVIRYSKGNIVEREHINRYNESGQKNGIWRQFFDNLNVSIEENYKNGTKDGLFKEYNEYGNITTIIKYQDDRIVENNIDEDSVSVVNEYNEDGKIVFSGTYKENIPIGIHRFFDTNGTVIKSYLYNDSGLRIAEGIININGFKEGDWKYYYTKGNVRSEGKYINNKETGNWKFYYENKKIEQTGEFKNGLFNGIWRWYYDNGNLRKEEGYFNGKEEGQSIEYDRNGIVIAKGEYIEGEKEGFWTVCINDHIEEGNYITGLKDGKWKYYYNDKSIMFEGNYVQGNADGKHKYYYENGSLKEEQYFSQGNREKHWKKYDREGNLIITISYQNNKEIRINGEKIDLNENQI